MGGGQPVRARVVEGGECALLQLLLRQAGRVEPGKKALFGFSWAMKAINRLEQSASSPKSSVPIY